MLTKIFRQAMESAIIKNAHKINDGEDIDLAVKTPDFFCLKRNQALDIQGVIIALVRDKDVYKRQEYWFRSGPGNFGAGDQLSVCPWSGYAGGDYGRQRHGSEKRNYV